MLQTCEMYINFFMYIELSAKVVPQATHHPDIAGYSCERVSTVGM